VSGVADRTGEYPPRVHLDEARRRLADLPRGLPAPGALPPPPAAITAIRVDDIPYAEPELAVARLAGDRPLRAAAALVLIVPDAAGTARLVLMQRTDDGGPHARQIACPGGSVEPDDADEAAAALREAEEEVGIDARAAGIEVVGRLERIVVAASGFVLDPFVAIAARPPALTPNPVEVGAILTPPLDAFLPGAPIVVREETIRGALIRYGGYPIEGGHVVWGATARILGQLGAVIGPV
jgi:ADP-ribose pyrophosphatase YjhB (NUDIX family)